MFTLLMQNFSHIIKEKVNSKEIIFLTKHGTRGVSHLAFMDDLLVFCKARVESFKGVKRVFDEFQKATRLRVSEAKSEFFSSHGPLEIFHNSCRPYI